MDVAGPRFWDGRVLPGNVIFRLWCPICPFPVQKFAIPELEKNRFDKHVATFVDAIHTDGSWWPCVACATPHFGTMWGVADLDFYVEGGADQPGCGFSVDYNQIACSHGRAVEYYIQSIVNAKFPSHPCKIGDKPWSECDLTGDKETTYLMGEPAEIGYHRYNKKSDNLFTSMPHWESMWK